MLVLSRHEGERIFISTSAGEIVITIVEVDRGKVRVGIEAPREMRIEREELRTVGRGKEEERKGSK